MIMRQRSILHESPSIFGISRAKFIPHWIALVAAIFTCSPKLSLRSSCTPRYLMLIFHLTSCSPRRILGYWKDLLSVTSKTSVFYGAILRPLLSNQRLDRHRLSLILSSRISTSSVVHTASASSAKPTMLVPAGRSMSRNSSYMTFQTSGPNRDHCQAPHVIFSLRDHLSPSHITYLSPR